MRGKIPIRNAPVLLILCLAGCGGAPHSAKQDQTPLLPNTPAEHVEGETVYDANCSSCHDSSRDGAPRLGYLAAWTRRLKQSEETLVQHATEGLDLMPPRGDNADLSDQQIRAAVLYMIYRAKLDIATEH